MIFILSFSIFVVPLPSISHFCTFFHLPLPSTPVWNSVCMYFLLFWCWYFLTYLTPLLLLFCPALSINPAPASFSEKKKELCSFVLNLLSLGLLTSALGLTLFFCSYLHSLGLSISALGFTLQILYFSLLDFCSLGTSLGLGLVKILLLLLLCIGFWGELADQGEAQWSPTSLASLYECPPVAIGLLSWHSV